MMGDSLKVIVEGPGLPVSSSRPLPQGMGVGGQLAGGFGRLVASATGSGPGGSRGPGSVSSLKALDVGAGTIASASSDGLAPSPQAASPSGSGEISGSPSGGPGGASPSQWSPLLGLGSSSKGAQAASGSK